LQKNQSETMPLITMPKLPHDLNESERFIVNRLSKLYLAESHIAYLYIEPTIKQLKPDFILLDPSRGVMIIEVKGWSINYIERITHKEIITSEGEILENPLAKARRYYNTLQGLFRFYDTLFDEQNHLKITLHSLVLFPNIQQSEIDEQQISPFLDHYPARVGYQESLATMTLDQLFDYQLATIDEALISTLKVAISPEIKLSHTPTQKKQTPLDREILALDVEQERFAKSLPLGHYMLSGIPGSGKTVTLLSRALYLAKCYPSWEILILTYTQSLASDLIHRLKAIEEDLSYHDTPMEQITILTFHQKANALSPLCANNFSDRDLFWRETLPNDALNYATPTYHAILIDEYQDFHKEWFALILKLLITHHAKEGSYQNLFLAGDRLQGIYSPKEINWKQDIGLDMRGRSKSLTRSYRSSKEHISFALTLLQKEKKYQEEVTRFYEGVEKIRFHNHTDNSLQLLHSNYQGVANTFMELLDAYDYEDILLLAPSWAILHIIRSHLSYETQKHIATSKKITPQKSNFTTYYSSKGIECKVAIVVDIDQINERKLLYVASTRASSRLILHLQRDKKSPLSDEVEEYFHATYSAQYP
jgi:hypothetical protein